MAWWGRAGDNGSRAWNSTTVQRWFGAHKNGKWREFADMFARLDGEDMRAMSKEDFLRRVPDNGDVVYYEWRSTCCAAGWAYCQCTGCAHRAARR